MCRSNSLRLFTLVFKSESINNRTEDGVGIGHIEEDLHIAWVFDKDIEKARERLEKFLEKQGGIIQPIPIDEGNLESMLWGLRCAKIMFIELLLTEKPILTSDDLKLMKKVLYEGIERKKRQIRRAQKLIERIKRLEETGNNDLVPKIIDEIKMLGIVWKHYEVVRQ